MMAGLYERDFHAWATAQATLLRAGQLAEADLEHLAEELEAMGRSEQRELVNRLVILLLHLLKWRAQPARRGNSWRLSIREQRLRLASHLADNPSLRARLEPAVARAYGLALIAAERETGLPETAFPADCPFSLEQLMDDGFWPEEASPE